MTDALSSSGPFLFVVVGATGHTGCACVDELLRLGHRVRGVVRSQQSAERLAAKGVEPCIVDVTDTQALTEAFCGAGGAYLLHPANRSQHDDDDWVATAEAVSRSLVTAAVRSKLRAVVALSSTGAQHSCGTGNVVHAHVFEQLLEESPLNYTVVRAPAFMDNWGREVDDVVEKGVLISLYWDAHRPFSQVAASDVGLCAARELLRRLLPGPEVTRRYVHEIRGPNDYSVDDVAAVFGNLLARPVHVVAIEPSDQAAWLRAKGVSATTASQVAERYAAQSKGMLDVVGDDPVTRGTVTLAECLGGFLSQRDA